MNCFNFKDVWFNEDRIDRFKRTKNNSLIVIQGKTHEEFHCVGEQTIEELENEFLRAMNSKDWVSHKDIPKSHMAAPMRPDEAISDEVKSMLQTKAATSTDFAFNEIAPDKVKKGKTLKTGEDVKEV